MKRSLKAKMILSYLVVAFIIILVVSVFTRLTSGQSLMNLVVEQQTASLKETAQAYYTAYGTMDGFNEYYLQTSNPQPAPDQLGGIQGPQPPTREFRALNGLIDLQHRALIPMFGHEIGDVVPDAEIKNPVPVEVNGETIAYILPDRNFTFKLSAEEELFLKRTNFAIGAAALTGILIAVGMGFLLASRLLKPIRRLTRASQELSQGELNQQVPVTSEDELGQLTMTFNKMTTDLYQADQERKRLSADITHDLSTPLQIISGYIEMLEGGEVQLTPERVEIIKTEIEHLRRLVGDLTTLSQVDAGGLDIFLQPTSPMELIERIYRMYEPIAARQDIVLGKEMPESIPIIMVDEGRTLQVMKNLVENALRYTPRGGQITLGVEVNEEIRLFVSDTGSGISREDLPYVFDRFYRADKSREGNSGKMGLGLAICKALVAAQNGRIEAASEGEGKGSKFTIVFADAISH